MDGAGAQRAASRACRSATTAAPSSKERTTIPSPSTTSRRGSGSANRSRRITAHHPRYLRPDSRELFVNMRDGVAVWNLDPEAQFHEACRLAGRDLTREESATYFGAIAPYR